MSEDRPNPTTTDVGILAPDDDLSLTVGPGGPLLLHDHYLLQKMAQFNRERVPERVVHAKGGGAHGYFEVTEDVTAWTKAGFLSSVGKRTPVFVRFSTVAGELGSADSVRDPRGFAIKFYTEDGNYDLVGNNTPVFFIRDPSKFSDFIHSQKRSPETGRRSNNAQWDFWTLRPESAHQVTLLMSDRGTPRTWRHMNGYGSHSYMWFNAVGRRFWVKYHLKTEQGIENFTAEEATAMAGSDPDCHRRDLYEAIAAGDYPSWRLEMQIMPFEDADDYRFNPFDVTKVWPQSDYSPMTVGRLVLDRNPENYFAEVEQAAFEPANMVNGIGPSPDRMLLGRLFSYPDAHRYRIGANYQQLPINQPRASVRSYSQDGAMRVVHGGNQPSYVPNSFGGPRVDRHRAAEPGWDTGGHIGRFAQELHSDDDDFSQARQFWRTVLTEPERARMVTNVANHLRDGVDSEILRRAIDYWQQVDRSLGAHIAAAVGARTPAEPDGVMGPDRALTKSRSGCR